MTVDLGSVVQTPHKGPRGFHREGFRSLVQSEPGAVPHWVTISATVRRTGAGNPERFLEMVANQEEAA